MKKIRKNLPSIIFIILVSLIGTLFTYIGMSWFDTLIKPKEWIPNYVIPIVWTIIYSLFLGYILVKPYYINNKLSNLLFFNGLLNMVWCFIFFTLNLLFLGLIVIVINLFFSILLLIEILKDRGKYDYILLIYPLWLSIATCLNISLWILN